MVYRRELSHALPTLNPCRPAPESSSGGHRRRNQLQATVIDEGPFLPVKVSLLTPLPKHCPKRLLSVWSMTTFALEDDPANDPVEVAVPPDPGSVTVMTPLLMLAPAFENVCEVGVAPGRLAFQVMVPFGEPIPPVMDVQLKVAFAVALSVAPVIVTPLSDVLPVQLLRVPFSVTACGALDVVIGGFAVSVPVTAQVIEPVKVIFVLFAAPAVLAPSTASGRAAAAATRARRGTSL
jgi:hypothetical protein